MSRQALAQFLNHNLAKCVRYKAPSVSCHPYPKRRFFEYGTIIIFIILLPFLILANVVTSGYEVIPDLRPDYYPTDTVPTWWNSPQLPPFLRRKAPACQPKDLGRGDVFRLTPALFEYKVLSSWRNLTADVPQEAKIKYKGASFRSCYPYEARFDFNQVEWTQTVTTAVICTGDELNTFMETTVTFADEISKDMIGQYYGYDTNPLNFLGSSPNEYRKAVFGVLDVISTDSIIIMHKPHLPSPILALSTRLDLAQWIEDGTFPTVFNTFVSYTNGTVNRTEDSMGEASIYQDTVQNLVLAVASAVGLDLGSAGPGNIFLNQSAVNGTFVANQAPSSISPDDWLGSADSWYYGGITGSRQTWAEMLRAGLPTNITLGNITGLPDDSKMVTNYLCPTYTRKQLGSLFSSVFVGTATMILSVWGAWKVLTTIWAKRIQKPCGIQCSCGKILNGNEEDAHQSNHKHGVTALEPSAGADKEKEGFYSARPSIQELPKQGETV